MTYHVQAEVEHHGRGPAVVGKGSERSACIVVVGSKEFGSCRAAELREAHQFVETWTDRLRRKPADSRREIGGVEFRRGYQEVGSMQAERIPGGGGSMRAIN